MNIKVINTEGKDTGRSVSLDESVFGIEPNKHVLYLDVKQYLANQRQGTHKSKERAEIAGSTRKIKKQKGTGTARAGSIKSPLFVGGGRVFGPRPRSYSFKLNKKVKSLARVSALSAKAKEDAIMIMENFQMDLPNTKQFLNILTQCQLVNEKSLMVFAGENKNVYLSSRNLKGVSVVNVSELNTYQVLNAGKVVFTEEALVELQDKLKK